MIEIEVTMKLTSFGGEVGGGMVKGWSPVPTLGMNLWVTIAVIIWA